MAVLCKVLVTVALLALIGIFLNPQQVWALLGEVQPWTLATIVGLSVIGLAIQWRKWQLLLASVRPQTTMTESLISLLVGFALGMASPGRIGELGRGVILSSDSRTASVGAATVDRLCAAAITIGLGLTALVFLSPLPGLLAATTCASMLIGFRLVSRRGRPSFQDSAFSRTRVGAFSRTRVGVFVIGAVAVMEQIPRQLWLRSLGLSLAFQVLLCTQFHLLATDWMATSTDLWLGIPLIFAAKALLPVAFLDLGVREAASVVVFSRLDFDPAVGFNCAMLLYAINVVIPAIAGTVLWSLKGRRSHEDPMAGSSVARSSGSMADLRATDSRRVSSIFSLFRARLPLALWLVLAGTAAGELNAQNAQMTTVDTAGSGERHSHEDVPPMVRLVGEGDSLAERGQIEAAIGKYEQARTIGAGSAYVLNRLSQLYMISSRPLDAIQLLQQSLSENPGQLPVYSMLGESFLAMGQIDSALHYVGKARELAPQVSSIRSYLGLLFLQSGRPAQAKAQLDSAVSFDARNSEAYRFLALYYTQLDSLERAVGYYEKVVELQQTDVEAHNNIAFLYSKLQRYADSLDYYRRTKSLTADPNIVHSINLNIEAVRAIMNGKLRARYILVDTEGQARDILRRLHRGEEFSALAARFSKAPNATLGGDLGFFGPGDMVAEVEETVLQLEPGALSDLIRIQQGVMILQRLN